MPTYDSEIEHRDKLARAKLRIGPLTADDKAVYRKAIDE